MGKTWRSWDFIELRQLYKKGLSHKDIAKTMNAPENTVSCYISNEIILGRIKKRGKGSQSHGGQKK